MAFKFNAILKFNGDAATRQLDKAGKGFNRMKRNIQSASAAMGKINQGIRGLALATAPATAGIAFATKTFADFEFQMKSVQSVLITTDEDMVELNNTAKLLGATTEFSAKQAGEGAEELARFGFTTQQIIGALPGLLDAASASQLGLKEATQIIAGTLGAFGLEASKAGEVADALAFTTALTGTNMTQLGEAMKFAAPKLKGLNLTVAQVASSLGVLANAGIRGSLAGTAMKNAFVKLAKPTKETLKLFGGRKAFNEQILETVKVGGKFITRVRPMEVVMANLAKAVQASKNPLAAARKSMEIFGLRGEAAFNSFSSALGKNIKITNKNLESLQKGLIKTELGENVKVTEENFKTLLSQARKSAGGIAFAVGQPIPKLVALRLQIAGAAGTAAKMRDIRLDSLTGQAILLKSAFEGINIELGGVFAGVTRDLIEGMTDILSVSTVAFQAATSGGKATEAQMKALADNGFAKFLPLAIEFATGFIEGFNEIVESGKAAFKQIIDFLKPIIGESNLTAKQMGKIAAKIIAIGAVAAPILAGLAVAFFVLGPIIAGISGAIGLIASTIGFLVGVAQFGFGIIGAVVAGLSTPLLGIIAAVVGIGLVVKAVVDDWTNVKNAFLDDGIIAGIKAIGSAILTFIQPAIDKISAGFSFVKGLFGGDTDETKVKTTASALGIKSDAVEDSAQILTESVKQKGIIQPPSAEKIGAEVQQQAASGKQLADVGRADGGGIEKLAVTTKIKGSDLLLVVTRAKSSNADRNGRPLSPSFKRKILQNGESF